MSWASVIAAITERNATAIAPASRVGLAVAITFTTVVFVGAELSDVLTAVSCEEATFIASAES